MNYLFLKWVNNPYKALGSYFILFLLSNIILCAPEIFCDPEKAQQSLTGGAPLVAEFTGGTIGSNINGNKLVVSGFNYYTPSPSGTTSNNYLCGEQGYKSFTTLLNNVLESCSKNAKDSTQASWCFKEWSETMSKYAEGCSKSPS